MSLHALIRRRRGGEARMKRSQERTGGRRVQAPPGDGKVADHQGNREEYKGKERLPLFENWKPTECENCPVRAKMRGTW